MLNIYANAFRTATRMGPVKSVDTPAMAKPAKKSWLPKGHWWIQQDRGAAPVGRRFGHRACE
jgi:hypothetical protein